MLVSKLLLTEIKNQIEEKVIPAIVDHLVKKRLNFCYIEMVKLVYTLGLDSSFYKVGVQVPFSINKKLFL